MIRASLFTVCASLALAAAGCQKSEEPPKHAEVAKGDLMPGPAPGFDATYVADQKQVKLVQRTVSYEPLDSFRSRAPEKEERLSSPAKSPREAKASKTPKKPGLLSRAKAALTDKLRNTTSRLRPPTAGGPAPGAPAGPVEESDDDNDLADEDDADEDDDLDEADDDEDGSDDDEDSDDEDESDDEDDSDDGDEEDDEDEDEDEDEDDDD